MFKLLAMGTTGLIGMGLAAIFQGPPGPDGPPPPPHEAKKKGGPAEDLRRAYDLLRHLRAEEGPAGKPEGRLRDLTERATLLYRKAVRAKDDGEERASHEYGIAAHDLARAVDHARNASRLGHADPELPPPPPGPGPEEPRERTLRDLRRAHDRIEEMRDEDYDGPDSKFYFEAARDLYTAARRDAEANRDERAGELARAAEAITHVPEHLARATEDGPDRPKGKKDRLGPKDKGKKDRKDDRPEPPREKRDRPGPEGVLPPPIDE